MIWLPIVYIGVWWLFVFCDAALCEVTATPYDIKESMRACLLWPLLLVTLPFAVHNFFKEQDDEQ